MTYQEAVDQGYDPKPAMRAWEIKVRSMSLEDRAKAHRYMVEFARIRDYLQGMGAAQARRLMEAQSAPRLLIYPGSDAFRAIERPGSA